MALSAKQQRFVDAYLVCWNAAEAARQAGYSAKTARQQGSRLLSNVDIKAEISRIQAEHMMSAQEVLYHLTEIGRGRDGETGVETRDRIKALELLSKYHDLTNRVKHEWHDQAVADIRLGVIPAEAFPEMAEKFGVDLATELFARAGVPITVGVYPGEVRDDDGDE